ncbi:MAG: hypothetical protein ABJC12_06525 [Saprospiraceae bacterium]
MNKNLILVRKIRHLTDARYFAAMGVDWMSLELNTDPASFMLWRTLKDWVEGVKLAAEINEPDEMLIAKTVIEAGAQGIILQSAQDFTIPAEIQLFFDLDSNIDSPVQANNYFILNFDLLSVLQHDEIIHHPNIFLQSEWSVPKIEYLLKENYQGGICFSGGEETTTGIRDYAIMDELIDLLIT